MKTDIWMPLYINDFLADTLHLSAEEIGAYMLIIMNYWKRGAIGGDIDRIAKFSRCATSITQALLEEFFFFTDGEWKHPRIEKELEKARENKAKRGERAKRAAEVRWAKNDAPSIAPSNAKTMLQVCSEHSTSNAKEVLEQCPSSSSSHINKKEKDKKEKSKRFKKPTVSEIKNYCQERSNGIDPEKFNDYYESKGWLVGKTPMKDWKAAVRTWERNSASQVEDNSNKVSATAPAADHIKPWEDVGEEPLQELHGAVRRSG